MMVHFMAERKYNKQTKYSYSFNLKLFGQNLIEYSKSCFQSKLFSDQSVSNLDTLTPNEQCT